MKGISKVYILMEESLIDKHAFQIEIPKNSILMPVPKNYCNPEVPRAVIKITKSKNGYTEVNKLTNYVDIKLGDKLDNISRTLKNIIEELSNKIDKSKCSWVTKTDYNDKLAKMYPKKEQLSVSKELWSIYPTGIHEVVMSFKHIPNKIYALLFKSEFNGMKTGIINSIAKVINKSDGTQEGIVRALYIEFPTLVIVMESYSKIHVMNKDLSVNFTIAVRDLSSGNDEKVILG